MKGLLRGGICFVLTAAVLLGLLVCCALIPREAVRENIRESAAFLCEGKQFAKVVDEADGSKIDRYADSILLGIAFQYDEKDPLRSVLVSKYYNNPVQNENFNLRDAAEQDLPANQQYLRYWHGSAGIVRLLMTFMTLRQVYVWHSILLGVLAAGVILRLMLRKEFVPAIGLAAGLIGISCWYIPMSLEYTWVFLILMIQLHLILMKRFPKDWGKRGIFFLISGMITNYLDFLSCETVTLLTPLLLMIRLDRKEEGKPSWKDIGKTALMWLAGYAGMYLVKWGLAAAAMQENVIPYVAEHVGERLVGTTDGAGLLTELIQAPLRNIRMLFPLEYGVIGGIAGFGIVIAAGYFGYVHHRSGFDKQRVWMYAAAGLVPYVRFLGLINHSYLHYFFTFRAQLSTLFALALIIGEVTGRGKKRGRR